MPGDGGKAHGERFRQLLHRRFALGEAGQDGAAGRVGQGGEGGVERHLTSLLNNKTVKYKAKTTLSSFSRRTGFVLIAPGDAANTR